MNFEKGYLYHIYNQGNNSQKIFFNHENYLFFIKKIKTYLLPYTDILAWCLMPNHFHLMVLVNETTVGVTGSHPDSNRTINNSIAILLRSYTRAINKQENRSGSLFRESTKAECINCLGVNPPSFIVKNYNAKIRINLSEHQYPQVCFDYIHQNPVKVNLVQKAVDWQFSSAQTYSGIRKEILINKIIAKEYLTLSG